MSTKILKEDNTYTVPGKVAIDKQSDTSFIKAIKNFFEKSKDAELRRIESTAKGSELFDLDVALKLPSEEAGKHAQEVRQTSSGMVHQLKQDLYNYLNKEGFKINSMSVRGVRTNGNEVETTISLILPNVPQMHREQQERVRSLIERTLNEVQSEDTNKKK